MFNWTRYIIIVTPITQQHNRSGSQNTHPLRPTCEFRTPYIPPSESHQDVAADDLRDYHGYDRGTAGEFDVSVHYPRRRRRRNTNEKTEEATSSYTPPPIPNEVKVDSKAYTSELCAQVSKLCTSLASDEITNDQKVQKDLLRYIRTMPKRELQSLTADISIEALEAMKGLVNVAMTGITNVGAEGMVKDGLETNDGDNGGEEGGENGGSSGDIPKIIPENPHGVGWGRHDTVSYVAVGRGV